MPSYSNLIQNPMEQGPNFALPNNIQNAQERFNQAFNEIMSESSGDRKQYFREQIQQVRNQNHIKIQESLES